MKLKKPPLSIKKWHLIFIILRHKNAGDASS